MKQVATIALSILFMAICIGLYGYFMEVLKLHPPFIINYLVGAVIGTLVVILHDFLKRISE